MDSDLIFKNFKSFLPLILSRDPCEIPTVNIRNRHSIVKLFSLKKVKAERIIQILKKINEW